MSLNCIQFYISNEFKPGSVCVDNADTANPLWGRLQVREIVGFENGHGQRKIVYSEWQDVPITMAPGVRVTANG